MDMSKVKKTTAAPTMKLLNMVSTSLFTDTLLAAAPQFTISIPGIHS